MKEYNSVELGNNFTLGTKYSESMKLYFNDENGEKKPYYMGCYGIGIGRIIATILENNVIMNEDKINGFILPYNIAPYKMQIIYKEDKKDIAEELYLKLKENGIDAILDDRADFSLGNKIQDVYTLGTPFFTVIGNKFDGTSFEIENSKTKEKFNVNKDNIMEFFKNL